MPRHTLAFLFAAGILATAETPNVDPTFLRRQVAAVAAAPSELTTATCRYKPLFGEGDRHARLPKGLTRFGEVTVEAGGRSAEAVSPTEEQVYVVLAGQGTLRYAGQAVPLKRHDFVYLPPNVTHGLAADAAGALRVMWMGWKVPANPPPLAAAKPLLANIDDVPLQVVGNHPPSTLYRLLLGGRQSKRDRIAAGLTVSSLFVMEFAPGGTNAPHHHEREEEVYLLLEGTGEMVAGGGMDGIEGRFPAQPGDAYFYRLNTTVGFYNDSRPGAKTARILAVRSGVPDRRPLP